MKLVKQILAHDDLLLVLIAVGIILRIYVIFAWPLDELADEGAHWHYAEVVHETGKPLNHAEQWITKDKTYQAACNPFYYYLLYPISGAHNNYIFARLLNLLLWMFCVIPLVIMAWKFKQKGVAAILLLLPQGIWSTVFAGGTGPQISLFCLAAYFFLKRRYVAATFVAAITAQLRVEGIVVATVLSIWLFFVDSKYRPVAILFFVITLVGWWEFYARYDLLIEAHTFVERDVANWGGIGTTLDAGFTSFWFYTGNNGTIFSFAPLTVAAAYATFMYILRTIKQIASRLQYGRIFYTNFYYIVPVTICALLVLIILRHSWSQAVSDGRYWFFVLPWILATRMYYASDT